MNYYGNVDQVLTPPEKYYIVGSKSEEFNGELTRIREDELHDDDKLLATSAEPVYMKYKSTPHAVIHSSEPISHATGDQTTYPYLHFAELRRGATPATDFGGLSRDAIHANLWYPAGPAVNIGYDAFGNELTDEHEGKT